MKPTFTHDCDKCRFLGTIPSANHGTVDLYVCTNDADPLGPSLIARFGDEGPDYASQPEKIVRQAKTLLDLTKALALFDAQKGTDGSHT